MIEKLPEFLDPETFPRFRGVKDKGNLQVLMGKIDELVEASNRQDRVIAFLLSNHPEIMAHMHKMGHQLREDAEYWQEEVDCNA
jgi:hypothetical protein